MMQSNLGELGRLVEPDRGHRSVYTDPAIFEREMATIFHKVWTYVGHETQAPKPGDYHTLQIGRQPMVMVRHSDNKIYVLYNRCAHRGAMVCGALRGNTGNTFTCSYHSWQYRTDGTLESIPLPQGAWQCDIAHLCVPPVELRCLGQFAGCPLPPWPEGHDGHAGGFRSQGT